MANRQPVVYNSALQVVQPILPGDKLDPIWLPPTTGGHTTIFNPCPPTGPTVAPTTEGHYYWTSAIGERWCWIYGDSAPFVCGKFYSATSNAVDSGLLDATGRLVGTPLTMYRTGKVTITGTLFFENPNGTGGTTVIADIASNGSTGFSTASPTCLGVLPGNNRAQALVVAFDVNAGDVIQLFAYTFGLQTCNTEFVLLTVSYTS